MQILTACIGFGLIVSVAFIASFPAVSTNTNELFYLDRFPHHDLRIQMMSDSVETWVRRYSVMDGAVGSAEMRVGDHSEALVLSAGSMNASSAAAIFTIGCKSLACSTDAAKLDGSTALLLSPDFLAEKMCGHFSTVTPSSVVFSAAAAYFESESGIGVSAAPPLAPPLERQGLHSLVMNASRFRRLHIYHLLLDSSQTGLG
jgi:hypothetical protein